MSTMIVLDVPSFSTTNNGTSPHKPERGLSQHPYYSLQTDSVLSACQYQQGHLQLRIEKIAISMNKILVLLCVLISNCKCVRT